MTNSLGPLLTRIRNAEINSSLMRRLLSFYYRDGKDYRIPLGPLRGLRLHYEPSVNFHVMLGLWEKPSYDFLTRVFREADLLRPGFVVADIGANLGYFSLWMAHQIGPRGGKVYAFEPSPSVLPLLEKNLLLNAASESTAAIEVVQKACSDAAGKIEFFLGHHHHISSLDAGWASEGKNDAKSVTVESTTLDAFFDARTERAAPDLIKVDIEGGGVFALKGMDHCLKRKRALFWIESHNPAEDRSISDLVLRHGYRAFRLQDRTDIEQLDDVHPNLAGIWGTMLLYPSEIHDRLRPALR